MHVEISHRYVCDTAKELKCTYTDNNKKCCKNCQECKLCQNVTPRVYICPLLSKLSMKASPLCGTIEVITKPYFVCSKWNLKKKRRR